MKIKGVVTAVMDEPMTECQVQVHHHQELRNKKGKILLEDWIFFEGIPQMFLQPILQLKILELVLDKMKKDF